MSIKTIFSISDLENLSGVKAHTIRIWEKRYNMLEPQRTDTNIRYYDLDNLQKILNVSLLLDHGLKISKIAQMQEDELLMLVKSLQSKDEDPSSFVNEFKVSMLNFDQPHFESIYSKLLSTYSFQDAFYNVFMTLLNDIGLLWSSKTITPVHEHFISTLIKQKMLLEIEKTNLTLVKNQPVFVLFLPINEIHELGLLFVHYMLLSDGKKSVFLGPSVPFDNLKDIQKVFTEITFISYFTVEPSMAEVCDYLKQIDIEILKSRGEQLLVTGRNAQSLNFESKDNRILLFEKLSDLIKHFN